MLALLKITYLYTSMSCIHPGDGSTVGFVNTSNIRDAAIKRLFVVRLVHWLISCKQLIGLKSIYKPKCILTLRESKNRLGIEFKSERNR